MSHHSPSSPLLPPLPELIDTSLMQLAYDTLYYLMGLAYHRGLGPAARELGEIARDINRAEAKNARTLLRIEMMLCPEWRTRVLRDLGGEKALNRWERLTQRLAGPKDNGEPETRYGHNIPLKKILHPFGTAAQRLARSVNLDKAKAALYERSKLFSPKADINAQTLKDRVKVDQEGQFRLAPIPRPIIHITKVIKRTELQTELPFKQRVTSIKYTKLNPIPIWPMEFRVAEDMAQEIEMDKSTEPSKELDFTACGPQLNPDIVSTQRDHSQGLGYGDLPEQ